jgi:hypothetical protein
MRAVDRAYQAISLAGTLTRLLRWLVGENHLSGHAGVVAAVTLMAGIAVNATAQEKSFPSPCTAMGCEPVFYSIALSWAQGWQPEPYEVTVTVDGQKCTIVAPEVCMSQRCDSQLPEGIAGIATCSPCASLGFTYDQNVFPCRAAGGNSQPDARIIFRTRQVEHVEVSVSRGGQVVGAGDYRPAYQRIQPNGPDCGPICLTANGDTVVIKP